MSTVQTTIDIRPFHVDIAEEKLSVLRDRIAGTSWPSRELVTDRSQGVQLATIKELARYWETGEYDSAQGPRRSSTRCRSSRPRSTAWTSTSSTYARRTRTRCR